MFFFQGALVKTDEQEVINFLLTTEIIPLCLRIMESGSELSKTVPVVFLKSFCCLCPADHAVWILQSWLISCCKWWGNFWWCFTSSKYKLSWVFLKRGSSARKDLARSQLPVCFVVQQSNLQSWAGSIFLLPERTNAVTAQCSGWAAAVGGDDYRDIHHTGPVGYPIWSGLLSTMSSDLWMDDPGRPATGFSLCPSLVKPIDIPDQGSSRQSRVWSCFSNTWDGNWNQLAVYTAGPRASVCDQSSVATTSHTRLSWAVWW